MTRARHDPAALAAADSRSYTIEEVTFGNARFHLRCYGTGAGVQGSGMPTKHPTREAAAIAGERWNLDGLSVAHQR